MAKKVLRRTKRDIRKSPLARQEHWPERPTEYQYFLEYVQGLSTTDLAIKYELSVGYVYNLSSRNFWHDRKVMLEGIQKHNAAHLTIPMEDFNLQEGETNDLINSRVASASEVLSEDYVVVAKMHQKMVAHCEAALENISTDNLSISEVKQLISATTDLAKLKQDSAEKLLGIEEISQLLLELQRKRGGK